MFEKRQRKPLKIAFFTDDYHPYVHGVVSSIDSYRSALEAMGHEVYVIAPKAPDFEDNDEHVIRMPSLNAIIFEKRRISPLYPGMERRLKKYDFDIVHSQTQFYMGVLAKIVSKKKNIPHISTMHTIFTEMIDDYPWMIRAAFIGVSIGYPIALKTKPVLAIEDFERDDLRNAGKQLIKKQGWKLTNMFFNQVDYCITPSQHLMKTLREHGLETEYEVLPNGLDITKYGQRNPDILPLEKKKNEKWIISVARMSGEKRPSVLIESMAHVTNKSCRLILVGDGPEREQLETLAQDLGVADKVVFAGMQDRCKVSALLAESDVFALASYRFDNQPVVILEAIASGLPVVYCDDQLTEGLTPSNACLTKGIEGQDFAAVFDKLLADETLRKKMGKASKTVAADFDIKQLAKRLEQIYYRQRHMHGYDD